MGFAPKNARKFEIIARRHRRRIDRNRRNTFLVRHLISGRYRTTTKPATATVRPRATPTHFRYFPYYNISTPRLFGQFNNYYRRPRSAGQIRVAKLQVSGVCLLQRPASVFIWAHDGDKCRCGNEPGWESAAGGEVEGRKRGGTAMGYLAEWVVVVVVVEAFTRQMVSAVAAAERHFVGCGWAHTTHVEPVPVVLLLEHGTRRI